MNNYNNATTVYNSGYTLRCVFVQLRTLLGPGGHAALYATAENQASQESFLSSYNPL